MQVFVIEPQLTMADVFHADKFNKEVVKQLREYCVELYEVNSKNIARSKLQLSGDAIVIVYNEHNMSNSVTEEVLSLIHIFGFRQWVVHITAGAVENGT